MRLSQLLKYVPVIRTSGPAADPAIGSIHFRAQEVEPGGLFVAIQGFNVDGHDFTDEALGRGAAAILAQRPVQTDTIVVEVENTRKALAAVASQFFGNPSESLSLIGITGTNAKTTTTYLVESMLSGAGVQVGVIGSINYRYGGKTFPNPMTTPESADIQRILAEMRDASVTHVAMEVSSHAIDLCRVENCWFDVGVFTNLSQDHLDYHKSMHSYWSCKRKLFTSHLNSGPKKRRTTAVINSNDAKGRELLRTLPIECLSTGYSNRNMVKPANIQHELDKMTGTISTPAGTFDFCSTLVGDHNLENILLATGVGIALKLPLEVIKAGIESIAEVPGRLEPIPNDKGKFVYVDYAHTPDALETVLSSLRSMATGRVICVFGCGGDRDPGKRPQMGEIAGRLSDLAIITSDNPRTEEPLKIIGQVLAGTQKEVSRGYKPSDIEHGFRNKGYVVEPDRSKAIGLGIRASRRGDTILIAGKGHETYQIIGKETVPFDDREEARRALQ